MALNVGSLWASLSLNISQFLRGLAQANAAARQAGNNIGNAFGTGPQNAINNTNAGINRLRNNLNFAGKDVRRIVAGIVTSRVFYSSLNAVEETTKAIVTFQNNMRTAAIAFEYFLGNEQRAKAFVNTMKDFAAVTPFTTEQALDQSKRLMAMGFAAESVKNVMQILVDTASATGGTAEQMDRVVLALGQMKTNGYIAGQELRQLAEAGIPIYKILREELGLTNDQLRKIGKLKISGDLGVAAVLKGLEGRYKGAAARIADTLPGMWSTVKDDFLIISEEVFKAPYEALTNMIRNIRDGMESMRQILRTSGVGGLLESLFPKELHTSVRTIIASFQSLMQSIGLLWKAIEPLIDMISSSLVRSLAVAISFIASGVRAIVNLVAAAMKASPAIKILVQTIIALTVANLAGKALMFLWSVVRIGAVCTAVAQAVMFLGRAIQTLYIVCTRNPIVGIIALIAAALISLALSSKVVSDWLDNVMNKLSSLAGIDVGKILQPVDTASINEWTGAFNKSLEDMGKNLKGVGKEAADTKKKMKDIMSFDEVYRLEDAADASDELADNFADLNTNLDLPDMPKIELPNFNMDIPGSDDNSNPLQNIPPILGENKNPPNGDSNSFPPPDTSGVASALETVESMIERLKQKLQPSYTVISNWITEVGNACITSAQTVDTFFTSTIPETANNLTSWTNDNALTVGNWLNEIAKNVEIWSTDTKKTIGDWSKESLGDITSWVSSSTMKMIKWAVDGISVSTVWADTIKANVKTWADNTKTNFTTWADTSKTTIINWAKGTGGGLYEWATKTSQDVITWSTSFTNNVNTWAQTTSTTIGNWINGTAQGIVTWANNVGSNFATWGNNVISNIGTWASSTWGTFGSWLSGTAKGVGTWASNTLATIVTWAKSAWGTISELASAAGAKIGSFLGWAGEGIKDTAVNIGTWANDNKSWLIPTAIGAAVIGLTVATVMSGGAAAPAFSLLALERGGYVDQEQLVRMGEKGRREVTIPLENDYYMKPFADAVANNLRDMAGGYNGSSNDVRPILYVGNLIASDQSLKELERRMELIRIGEAQRKGGY
jgi:tape measure domain-containing protein